MISRTRDQLWLGAALFFAALANASGLFVTILEPDSALYAVIAKTMVERHDFVNLVVNGQDWLDKPHLPFWLSAASFATFGVTAWAYKLPALVLVLVAAAYTYAFAKVLYDQRVALVAAVILLTAQHIILSSSDVRAEATLTAFVIGAVFHFHEAATRGSHLHLVAGSLLAAAAVMTKGIFTLIPIGGAIALGFLMAGQWRQALNVRWLTAGALIFVFITPELYCLWQQFDAHPEKVVFGRTGVSGLRFFFWDSQFGRFFNTGPIRGRGDPFQYLHVILWAFLPWSIPFYAAAYQAIRGLFGRRSRVAEYFNLSGGLLTFLLFSASQFQLPHYLNIAFPFFAIMTSAYLYGLSTQSAERWTGVWQWVFVTVASIVGVAVQFAFRPDAWAGLAATLAVGALVLLYLHRREWEHWQARFVVSLASVAVLLNLFLNFVITPALMKYQAGSEMAFYLNEHYPGQPVLQVRGSWSWALAFYLKSPSTIIDASMNQPQGTLVYGSPKGLRPLADTVRVVHRAASYPVSRMTPAFLNPATRAQRVDERWLVQVEKRQ